MADSDIVNISKGFNRQLVGVVRRDLRRGRRSRDAELDLETPGNKPSRFKDHAVILDAALAAATHSLTGASSCLATLCKWSVTDGEYIETDKQLTVWNHSEQTGHAADTFGVIRHIDGHWHFFGDCGPMAAR
jgi:hypothetical protein